jgi:hypothetical protein
VNGVEMQNHNHRSTIPAENNNASKGNNIRNYKEFQMLIPIVFGIFGFILTFFIRRGLNIVVLGILLYATLKGLEKLKGVPDWENFDKFISLLQQLGKTILMLTNNMIASAGTVSIMLFLCGAMVGLLISRRSA